MSKKAKIAIISILSIIIIGIIIAAICITPQLLVNNKTLSKGNVNVTVNIPKNFKYEEENEDVKTAKITKNDGEYTLLLQIDTDTIKYWYNEDFTKYKEDKVKNNSAKEVTINGVTGFEYYDTSTGEYQIILPTKEQSTVKLVVIPVNRFENPTAEQIVNEEDVQNIVNSIKIN